MVCIVTASKHEEMREQSDATEFLVMSHLLKTLLLEPADRSAPRELIYIMQLRPTPLRRISEDQKWHYLEHGGLDGSELRGETMEDSTEFDAFVSSILGVLERHGKIGLEQDCGYYVNRYAVPDYFPCIEVKAVEFVTLELISQLHSETSIMPAKYRIDVCNALGYWNEDLNIFIEHDVIYWYSESDATAATVGLMSLAFLPAQ